MQVHKKSVLHKKSDQQTIKGKLTTDKQTLRRTNTDTHTHTHTHIQTDRQTDSVPVKLLKNYFALSYQSLLTLKQSPVYYLNI